MLKLDGLLRRRQRLVVVAWVLVIVPAAMAVMGKWNWWLPRPLQRLLPHTEIERLKPALETSA